MLDIKDEANSFLKRLFENLNQVEIDLEDNFLDHICFRTETASEYEHYKELFKKSGELLVESEVGGRLIATYKLFEPIVYEKRRIHLIELPSPKIGSFYQAGFEHAEFVISESFRDFSEMYPKVSFDSSAVNKGHNPELRLKFSDGLSIKLHHKSLEEVIEIEKTGL